MSGVQHINIQQSGRMLISVVAIVLVFSFMLCSCSSQWFVGDGRGDWIIELYDGYYLNKVNSNCISLVTKDDPNDSFSEYILPPFFVTSYQVCEPYICIEGVLTEDSFATEDELNNPQLVYFIIDCKSHNVIGPFETSEDFLHNIHFLGIELKSWNRTNQVKDQSVRQGTVL